MFSPTGGFFSVPSSTTEMSLIYGLQGMFGMDDTANKQVGGGPPERNAEKFKYQEGFGHLRRSQGYDAFCTGFNCLT